MPQSTARPNTKRIYEKFHNIKLPKGMVVHHVLPVRLGGTHDVDNLVAMTVQEHADAHMALYEEHGDSRDLCAYHMILGFEEDAHKFFSHLGGKTAQENRREKGLPHPFTLISPEDQRVYASLAGKKGGTACKERKLGIHSHTREDNQRYGKMSGDIAVAERDWASPDKQAARGKRGGVKNAGFRWYTDGINEFKYTKTQQESKSFEDFISETGFVAGKLPHYIDEVCPNCGDDKIIPCNRRFHFDNCRYPPKVDNDNPQPETEEGSVR